MQPLTPALMSVDEARRHACEGDPLPGMPGNMDTSSIGSCADDRADRYNAWSEALWDAGKQDASTLVFCALNREGYWTEARDCQERFGRQVQVDPQNALAACRLAYVRYCASTSPKFHGGDLRTMREMHDDPGHPAEADLAFAEMLLKNTDGVGVSGLRCFTEACIAEATERLRARCAGLRFDGACSESKAAYVAALEHVDLFGALHTLDAMSPEVQRDVALWMRGLAASVHALQHVDPDVKPERIASVSGFDDQIYVHVHNDDDDDEALAPAVERAIVECARRLRETADVQEALAILRATSAQYPDYVAPKCALARVALELQARADLIACCDAQLLDDHLRSREDPDAPPAKRALVLGQAGVALLREGIEAIRAAASMPQVEDIAPLRPATDVALLYVRHFDLDHKDPPLWTAEAEALLRDFYSFINPHDLPLRRY